MMRQNFSERRAVVRAKSPLGRAPLEKKTGGETKILDDELFATYSISTTGVNFDEIIGAV
jgi:hypothetical protein